MKNIVQLFFIAILALTTTFDSYAQGKNYYSAGNLDASALASWGKNADGSGTTPANFDKGDIFHVSATHNMTMSTSWTLGSTGSKHPSIIVEGTLTNSGTIENATTLTLTIDGTLTNNGTITNTTTGVIGGTGTIINGATGTLNIAGTISISTLTATASGNTVNYTGAAQSVIATTYSNLGLSGSGEKTISTGT